MLPVESISETDTDSFAKISKIIGVSAILLPILFCCCNLSSSRTSSLDISWCLKDNVHDGRQIRKGIIKYAQFITTLLQSQLVKIWFSILSIVTISSVQRDPHAKVADKTFIRARHLVYSISLPSTVKPCPSQYICNSVSKVKDNNYRRNLCRYFLSKVSAITRLILEKIPPMLYRRYSMFR